VALSKEPLRFNLGKDGNRNLPNIPNKIIKIRKIKTAFDI
jgi:hypothetical protein